MLNQSTLLSMRVLNIQYYISTSLLIAISLSCQAFLVGQIPINALSLVTSCHCSIALQSSNIEQVLSAIMIENSCDGMQGL